MASRTASEWKSMIRDFDRNTFGDSILLDMFETLGREKTPPRVAPRVGEHPRVLLTKDMLPGVRAAMEKEIFSAARAEYEALIAVESDGILPPSFLHEKGRLGHHNVDYRLLAVIQAKALRYLLSEREEHGYEAIAMMLNYMKSLDLKWIQSDQCREFGLIIYTAACVYDWCYPLLDEKTMFLFTSAVEHKMMRGNTEDTVHSTYGGIKTEMGFPPSRQGAVSGHGSEMQLQRDYLSYAIAIYDEIPGWWEFIGHRFFAEYVPTRRIYYATGMYPQGMSCYAPWRYLGDLYGAWLIKGITGKSPYSADMARVVHSFAANETASKGMFPSGDANRTTMHSMVAYSGILTAHIYHDATSLAIGKWLECGYSVFTYGVANVTPTELLICVSNGVEPIADHHDGIDMVLYNDGYLGQLITRNSWASDAAVSFAKIGQRTTSNHDHQDAGHFQIYYKGLLTSDEGVYSGYGTPQWGYYHQGSVGHNCLLIENPARIDTEPKYNESGRLVNADRYWYCGGQIRPHTEARDYTEWLNGSFERAELRGVKWGLEQDGETPKYSYISGDLTKSYPTDTVDFVSRSMLTAYTGNSDIPMLFFVCDRIDAKSPDFKKTFLLQAPVDAPVIDGSTVTLTAGEGKLTLTSLLGADRIEAIGGSPETNAMIRGNQCMDVKTPYWGRVEISPATGSKSDSLLQVMYVSDKDGDAKLSPTLVRSDCGAFVGATAGNVTALFSTEKEYASKTVSFDAEKGDCYVAGLMSGKWTVSLNGVKLCDRKVRVEEGFLTFSTEKGRITLTLSV